MTRNGLPPVILESLEYKYDQELPGMYRNTDQRKDGRP